MRIETKKLETIKPYWRNPRKSENTIEELKKSIIKFGFKVPLVVDEEGVIITGHARYKALLQLKDNLDKDIKNIDAQIEKAGEKEKKRLTALSNNLSQINKGEITVVIADDLTEEKVKEYRIADNKLNELSLWDTDKLKYELKGLDEVVGFSKDELDALLKEIDFTPSNISSDDINKVQTELDGRFSDLVYDERQRMKQILCPYCGKEFGVRDSINV